MTNVLRLAFASLLIGFYSQSYAQDENGDGISAAAEHARVIKLAYDAAHLAHALQYHQSRTMLAGIGDYTRYGYSERITENNWFFSQIEETELQLPRMRQAAGRLQPSDEDAVHLDAMFAELEALLAASRLVHSAIRSGDLEAANRHYYEETDDPYNATVAAAHTLIANNERAITMIRLRAR